MATVKTAKPAPARCTNCGSEAKYVLGDKNNVINYCDPCLPKHFHAEASAGKYSQSP